MATDKYLRHIYLFESFTDTMIKSLADKTKFLQCLPGQVLIEQGKMNHSLWMLIRGNARVCEQDGKKKSEIYTLKPGDIFGELTYADTLPASATVEAADECVVLRVRFQDLEEVLQKQPLIKSMMLRKMIKIISQRLRKANETLREQLKSVSPAFKDETSKSFKSIEVTFGGLKASGHLPEGADKNVKVKEASGKTFEGMFEDEEAKTDLFDMNEVGGIMNIEPFSQE
jgi:CRP/FNR family cyclic AMP-dependent transcriptional regulator